MLAYLLMNDRSPQRYLIWDEPEANPNPKRAKLMRSTGAALATAGTQIFLATHDYALAYEIALMVDTGVLPKGATAFFALYRTRKQIQPGVHTGEPGVFVERGDRLPSFNTTPSSTPSPICTTAKSTPSSRMGVAEARAPSSSTASASRSAIAGPPSKSGTTAALTRAASLRSRASSRTSARTSFKASGRRPSTLSAGDEHLYLIEVKDYRGHAIDTKQRQTNGAPHLHRVCKVRDTIAGLVGASRKGEERWVEACAERLLDRSRPIRVVAWIVDAAPRPAEPDKKRIARQGTRRNVLGQKLACGHLQGSPPQPARYQPPRRHSQEPPRRWPRLPSPRLTPPPSPAGRSPRREAGAPRPRSAPPGRTPP